MRAFWTPPPKGSRFKVIFKKIMKYDYKTLYQKNAEFFTRRKNAVAILRALNLILTCSFFVAYALFLWHAIAKDFYAEELVFIIGAPMLCFFLSSVLRAAVARPRPYDEAGAQIEPLLRKKSKDKKSFPSRHLACSFVIATVLLHYLVGAGICLLLFGCVLGYLRFTLGLHYPSDLFAGSALGVLCAIFCGAIFL